MKNKREQARSVAFIGARAILAEIAPQMSRQLRYQIARAAVDAGLVYTNRDGAVVFLTDSEASR